MEPDKEAKNEENTPQEAAPIEQPAVQEPNTDMAVKNNILYEITTTGEEIKITSTPATSYSTTTKIEDIREMEAKAKKAFPMQHHIERMLELHRHQHVAALFSPILQEIPALLKLLQKGYPQYKPKEKKEAQDIIQNILNNCRQVPFIQQEEEKAETNEPK